MSVERSFCLTQASWRKMNHLFINMSFEVESSYQTNRRHKLICSLLASILICVGLLIISQIITYWLLYQASQMPIVTEIQQVNVTDYKIRIDQVLTEMQQINVTDYKIRVDHVLTHINQTLNQTDKLLNEIRRFIRF